MGDLLKEISVDSENEMKGRFLTFLIGDENYGIAIENVVEIIGIQPITEMPEMPDYIKGIINLRGSIVPAMDIRLRFKKPEADYTKRTCIIVIHIGGMSTGLIVDCVSEVQTIPDEEISATPEIRSGDRRGYVRSIGKTQNHIILLLDCEKLLNEVELETVSAHL